MVDEQAAFNRSSMDQFHNYAAKADEEDELKGFRDYFLLPTQNGREKIYFLGNSLGLQPKTTSEKISSVLQQWHELGVEGFFKGNKPWLDLHSSLAEKLAPIVGALPSEITVMNQLTVNLHLMLVSFYKPIGRRRKILCESKAFPSDQYMLQTHLSFRGFDPEDIIAEVTPADPESNISTGDILTAIEKYGDELALVFIGGINYYSGQLFDMQAITTRAHKAGALCGFDLAHAAGNVFLDLHKWDVDFACWCSYKYLNAGPGAIAGAFIHERYHRDQNISRFGGWWGYPSDDRFIMKKEFVAAESAEGWQLSTPSILLYACHEAALEIFAEAGMAKILSKGLALSSFLLRIIDEINKRRINTIKILTPRETNQRGCQVSISIPGIGKKVFDHLTAQGIFADWREPDVIRVAPVPLYNSFTEVARFGEALEEAIVEVSGDRL